MTLINIFLSHSSWKIKFNRNNWRVWSFLLAWVWISSSFSRCVIVKGTTLLLQIHFLFQWNLFSAHLYHYEMHISLGGNAACCKSASKRTEMRLLKSIERFSYVERQNITKTSSISLKWALKRQYVRCHVWSVSLIETRTISMRLFLFFHEDVIIWMLFNCNDLGRCSVLSSLFVQSNPLQLTNYLEALLICEDGLNFRKALQS